MYINNQIKQIQSYSTADTRKEHLEEIKTRTDLQQMCSFSSAAPSLASLSGKSSAVGQLMS